MDRDRWVRGKQIETFLAEVDRRYPNLNFETLHEDQIQTIPARQYLSTEMHRHENESTFVRCAATEIAALKAVDEKDACNATTANARLLFARLFFSASASKKTIGPMQAYARRSKPMADGSSAADGSAHDTIEVTNRSPRLTIAHVRL